MLIIISHQHMVSFVITDDKIIITTLGFQCWVIASAMVVGYYDLNIFHDFMIYIVSVCRY